jgi:hypothetical protein
MAKNFIALMRSRSKWLGVFFIFGLLGPHLHAGTTDPASFPAAIEDNSFLIEEAYNQEPRVVQHIFTALHFRLPGRSWGLSFTQEWPLAGVRHQLSYTLPFASLGQESVSGFGDILVNYRYQIFDKTHWAAVAPRLSLIVPSGSRSKGLGNGVFGLQVNVPASKRLSRLFAAHVNVGCTILPGVKDPGGDGGDATRTLTSLSLGGSLIWLATPEMNLMLEILGNRNAEWGEAGLIMHRNELYVSPGLRRAINLGALQIVAGLAAPLRFIGGRTYAGVFLYLSFEHPF